MNNLSSLTLKEKRKLSFVQTILKPISRKRGPYIEFEIQKGNFLIKTATTKEELMQAYELRYEVFHNEFGGKKNTLGLDYDRYDKQADLLVTIDLKTQKVIGTYRVICSAFSKKFYSSSEFSIQNFLDEKDVKVELSRACIHKDYRNGSAIRLLWRGVYYYLNQVKARYLFGCSSISELSSHRILSIMQYLHKNKLTIHKWGIVPHHIYDRSRELLRELGDIDSQNSIELFPALFRAYLNAGAKFEIVPAYDANFSCYDFFTVLDVRDLKATHIRTLGAC